MSNLGGESSGAFPAVEAPDNIAVHWSGGPDWWHCDKADFLEGGYPQTREDATKKMQECRNWAQRILGDGLVGDHTYCDTTPAKTWLCSGVASRVHLMLDANSNVNVVQPGNFSLVGGCSYGGSNGRIKCEVLQQIGYALHTIQDFYSHSNYADVNESWPFTWTSPPGLGSQATPAFWDLKQGNNQPLLPDARLSSGCYPDSGCITASRTAHQHLNKDKSDINPITGEVTNPKTNRGKIVAGGVTNTQRAVQMAIRQTRAAWVDLQQLILAKEGPERGAKIICAITSDTPNQCGNNSSGPMMKAMSMPQGEIPEPTKRAPFDWMVREFEQQASAQTNLETAPRKAQVSTLNAGGTGISHPNTTNCGERTVEATAVLPGGLGKIIAHNLVIAGTDCKTAVRLLHKAHQFYAHGGRGVKVPPKLQCITLTNSDDGESVHARIVCKNQDESIETSFFPTCFSNDGDCGL